MVNVPNLITLFRVFLVPVFIMSLLYGKFKLALSTFIIASLSDALDGFLARRLNQVTQLGVILDPLADKSLIDSGYVLLSFNKGVIPVWLTIIVISRDILIIAGGWLLSVFGKLDRVKPTHLGKATAFLQFTTLLFALIALNYPVVRGGILNLLFLTTALFTVASALHYTFKGIRELNSE